MSMTPEELKAIEERANKATPGPWMWDISTTNQMAMLETAHSGRYYVMGFERWGLNNACPAFQIYKTYDGTVTERGSMGMVRTDKLAKSYPGKEHHIGFDDFIDHPDAEFIAHAREDIDRLLAEVKRLQKELGAAKDDLERYTTCQVCGNTKCYKRNGRENCKWEWRGVKGE
jgi:hypothetical protein